MTEPKCQCQLFNNFFSLKKKDTSSYVYLYYIYPFNIEYNSMKFNTELMPYTLTSLEINGGKNPSFFGHLTAQTRFWFIFIIDYIHADNRGVYFIVSHHGNQVFKQNKFSRLLPFFFCYFSAVNVSFFKNNFYILRQYIYILTFQTSKNCLVRSIIHLDTIRKKKVKRK